jgi:acyl carrier protein
MTNLEKLKELVIDVFLLDPAEFRLDLTKEQVDTWDSLALVSLAVGLQSTFGYHPTPDEAMSIQSVQDVIRILSAKGVRFEN